ncbi:MAG: hypothetical protein M0006_03320 [Magnetospirillum sp.]|nr:hypothetical protein [Magnetospirillum sp.]
MSEDDAATTTDADASAKEAPPAPEAHADAEPPLEAAAPIPWRAAALAGLRAWQARHCRDSAISRDTRALNVIHNAVAAIEAAIGAIRE